MTKTTQPVTGGVASADGRDAVGSFWKEPYAERRVLAKVRISCELVHPVTRKEKSCDRKTQLRALKARKAAFAELEETIRTAKEGSWKQVQAMGEESHMNHENFTPDVYLARIRSGYPLHTARCTGTGRPDPSGHRFSRFRCYGRVDWDTLPLRFRLAVRVTGHRTFRWRIV